MLPRLSKCFSHAYEAGVKSVSEYRSSMHVKCMEQADEYARQIHERKMIEEGCAELQHREQFWRDNANSYVNASLSRVCFRPKES